MSILGLGRTPVRSPGQSPKTHAIPAEGLPNLHKHTRPVRVRWLFFTNRVKCVFLYVKHWCVRTKKCRSKLNWATRWSDKKRTSVSCLFVPVFFGVLADWNRYSVRTTSQVVSWWSEGSVLFYNAEGRCENPISSRVPIGPGKCSKI